MNTNKNGTVGVKSGVTAKQTFSISSEFAHIIPVIKEMGNASRFICEAISEKLERQKNPGKDVADALAQFVQLQSIITSSQIQPIQTLSHVQSYTGGMAQPSPSVSSPEQSQKAFVQESIVQDGTNAKKDDENLEEDNETLENVENEEDLFDPTTEEQEEPIEQKTEEVEINRSKENPTNEPSSDEMDDEKRKLLQATFAHYQ